MTQEGTEVQRDQIIRHLEVLNGQVKKQNSVWCVFRNGIFYGMGFVVGSTILTALVISTVLQFFRDTILGDVIMWIAAH